MTEKRDRILREYLEKLAREERPSANRKSTLEIYFKYLDEMNIDFLSIGIVEAQSFQTSLTVKTGDDGTPYYGTGTVLAMITRITSFYDYLKLRKRVFFNPFRVITRLREEKALPRDILSEDDMSRVLQVLRDFTRGKTSADKRRLYKAHVIAELMYSTGARIHEIAGLTVDDVDTTRGIVRLRDSKTGRERQGILNEYTANILRIYMAKARPYVLTGRSDGAYLFGSHDHIRRWINGMTREALRAAVREKRNETVHVTSHSFRHSMASHLLKNGCDIRYIQEILGHESIGSTQVYTRVVKEDLREIIDMYHPRSFQKTEAEERGTHGERK